ncbi:MAG TPA: glucosamine-6-phosphate deaminase [Puia sp.]|nr:glucosamine-6-phosphate deaminase [Puia sp.]
MKIIIKENMLELGKAAGQRAARLIKAAIEKKDQASIILATGTSQFETLNQLIKEDIHWSKVNMFHLDEYIGLPESSPACFRKYLKERFIEKISALKNVYLINGEEDAKKECSRLGEIIKNHVIDVALVGIGENGHLGFNDPPADFETDDAFIVVDLDTKCRNQQLGEGWFKSIDEVPKKAITMSIKQIMKANQIICSVPEGRKAMAVKDCFENAVAKVYPASVLQKHRGCICFLDKYSSGLLTKPMVEVADSSEM